MKKLIFLMCLVSLASCGKYGKNGKDGRDGASYDPLSVSQNGIDFVDIEPGLACENGGINVFTFKDKNGDGLLEDNEAIIKIKAICNGVDGHDGTNGVNGTNASLSLESVASSSTCPNGGVKISSTTSFPVEVCNGENGLNGAQGVPGVQGIPGVAGPMGPQGPAGADGKSGTIVTPVKFCATDNSTYPEYGLIIGEDLFAVYWGTTPGSPNASQAFLTKLVAGNYKSTGGNNCLFSIK